MAGLAPAISPFLWGPGSQPTTKAEIDRARKIADALRTPEGFQPKGWGTLIGGLADEGVAAYRDYNTDQAEKTAQQKVADALASKDYMGVLANDMATPQQSAVATALWQQDQQNNDPLRKLQIETAQENLNQMRNPTPKPPEAPKTVTVYDEQTGRDKVQQWNPSTGAWEDLGGVKAPAEPLVQVNTGDNSTEFAKQADKAAADRLGTYIDAGNQADKMVGDLKTLAALGAQLETGKGAEITQALGPYAQAVGIDIKGLPEMQAYQSIVDRLAPQMRPAGAGATSDFDARQFLSSLPGLGKTGEGNQIILQTLSALQQRNQAGAEIAAKAFLPKEQGGISWQEAEKQIRSLPDPYEGFNKYRTQAEAKNDAVVLDPNDDAKAKAQYDALPSGAKYVDNDGMTYRKP